MSYRDINIDQFDYPLPEERIAAYPLARGESKLLIYDAGEIEESQYKHIDQKLPENAWLILNETKVVQARLLFPKNEQSLIEVFCLEPLHHKSMEQAMQAKGQIDYLCLVGGARKWKDHPLEIDLGHLKLRAEKIGRRDSEFEISLSWNDDLTFAEVLELAGKTPLPPYIKRQAEAEDKTTYQTTYARRMGSVAAPTAGLHFNDAIFDRIKSRGGNINFLTLHVGAGTFKPVSTSVAEHEMHAEELFLERSFIKGLLSAVQEERPVVTVGTTSLRALESMFWLGALFLDGKIDPDEEICIPQWIGFDGSCPRVIPAESLKALLDLLDTIGKDWLSFKTQIIIAPGYRHQLINALITNFHQPKSTLMLLVSSLIGKDWEKVYRYALENDFRFLSYGDGCLLNYRS